ncbi:MAG TPA: phage holin family protein [Candidatus Paceibacterota bacterium]|nr:phage holin family protein [Candidatus Paceibacterota bacterium]
MVRRFLLKIVVGAVALWVADVLLAGFVVTGGLKGYLIAGVFLAILNTFVRPILKLLSLPLILLTLGLFTVVINGVILWLVADLSGVIMISGLWTLLWATFIVSLVYVVVDHPLH